MFFDKKLFDEYVKLYGGMKNHYFPEASEIPKNVKAILRKLKEKKEVHDDEYLILKTWRKEHDIKVTISQILRNGIFNEKKV